MEPIFFGSGLELTPNTTAWSGIELAPPCHGQESSSRLWENVAPMSLQSRSISLGSFELHPAASNLNWITNFFKHKLGCGHVGLSWYCDSYILPSPCRATMRHASYRCVRDEESGMKKRK
jgi:hypothetical protein